MDLSITQMSAFTPSAPKVAMRSVFCLITLLLVGCKPDSSVEDSKPASETEVQAESNSLPMLAPIVVEHHEPNLVEQILQAANSRAQVSFVTNAEGVECKLASPDREDRLRVQALVTSMFGSCKGTVDPPTVTFKVQPVPAYRPASVVRAPQVSGDDVSRRLQERERYEKERDAREIHDLEAEISSDEAALLTIGNRAVAFNQAEIVRAKKSRLGDLKAFYVTKYKENP